MRLNSVLFLIILQRRLMTIRSHRYVYVFGAALAAAVSLVAIAEAYSPYVWLQAEGYSQMLGVVRTTDITDLDTGDWTRYPGIAFGSAGAKGFVANLGVPPSNAGGIIEVRLDSVTSVPVARLKTVSTGAWGTYVDQAIVAPTPITGVHDVYLTFVGQDVAALNSFGFTSTIPDPQNPPADGGSGGGVDASAPTVSVTAPTASATISGTISVSASASDDIGVVGVQFKLDGTNLGIEDTLAPYTLTWNSGVVGNGTHTLTAVARDEAGNTTTSAGVTFTVSNGGGTTPPPPAPTPPPTGSGLPVVTLSANPSIVDENMRTTITWSATNATYCYSSMTGTTGVSGSWQSPPLITTRTYSFTCIGPGGGVGKSITVDVRSMSVPPTTPPPTTPPPTGTSGNRNAFKWIEAESRNTESGTTISGGSVRMIGNGDSLCYTGVIFGSTPALSVVARIARANTTAQSFIIRLGSITGTPIGKLVIPATGSDSTFYDQGTALTRSVTGTQTICITAEGGTDGGAFDKFVFLTQGLQCPQTGTIPAPAP